MVILGIAAYYHDSSAAIMVDGKIVAAAQEERFSRIKHDNSFPEKACRYCLEETSLTIEDVDVVVFYEKPFLKFERILVSQITNVPQSLPMFLRVMPIWLKEKLNMRGTIEKKVKHIFGAKPIQIEFVEHHLSHAAIAYLTSGYPDADILVVDAVGEWATTSIFHAEGNNILLIKEQRFPDSIGMLYSAFTQFLGFKVNSDEYKVMGLAPYGNSQSEQTKEFIALIKNKMMSIREDGLPILNLKYFKFHYSDRMFNQKKWEQLFGLKTREPFSDISQAHKNMAYAIQHVTEKILERIIRNTRELSNTSNLCLSGGVALNCAATGRLKEAGVYKNVFTPFAPGDCGCSIGAILAYCMINGIELQERVSPYLGPSYSDEEVEQALNSEGINYITLESEVATCDAAARQLASGKIIGWFQGRMELGPRALGNRSIIADARNPQMKDLVNARIKFREWFRPFAPSVLEEYASSLFEGCNRSPYMMSTYKVSTDVLPAVTHEDNTARVQTVSKKDNIIYHQLLSSFCRLTGCPVILNTSFNVMGEPIVCSPEDAVNTFLNSGLDTLFINNYMITK